MKGRLVVLKVMREVAAGDTAPEPSLCDVQMRECVAVFVKGKGRYGTEKQRHIGHDRRRLQAEERPKEKGMQGGRSQPEA